MKRFIAAFAAALMLAVGAPGVANATETFDTEYVLVTSNIPNNCSGGWLADNAWKFTSNFQSKLSKIQFAFGNFQLVAGSVVVYDFAEGQFGTALKTFTIKSQPSNHSAGIATYETVSPLILEIGHNYYLQVRDRGGCFADPIGDFTGEAVSVNGPSSTVSHTYPYEDHWNVPETFGAPFALFDTPTADPLTTTTPTLKRNGISFTPDNFDSTCTYEISTTAGTAIQDPVTGEVNVYGVGSGSSVTVTITDCTGATATVSGKATAATAAVQTLTKPTVTSSAELITCSAGTSTVNPSSIAYTLLVDGVAVSTRFSDGAIAPSLVATTAAQNLYSGATLSKASWSIDPAWAGKSYSCTTTSYAAGAVGIANS